MTRPTRLKMNGQNLTFRDGCEMYLTDCRQRNLRPATINHYKQSYKQMSNYFDFEMPLLSLNSDIYEGYILYLKEHLTNDISINAYLRDLIATLHFLMAGEYIKPFKMRTIKVDKAAVETYTDKDLTRLLQKPNINRCSFTEFESWAISCLLLSTGIRQHSLMELRISDIDFDNGYLNVRVTKTRKPLLIPLNASILAILRDFLKYRQGNSRDDWLFCNAYGNKLTKSTSYHMIYDYNKKRGVETTGLHRYRHTFAKQWILNGGNVVTLSRLLGHSNLSTTQNYVNLLVSEIATQVNEIDLINQFIGRKHIKMRGDQNENNGRK